MRVNWEKLKHFCSGIKTSRYPYLHALARSGSNKLLSGNRLKSSRVKKGVQLLSEIWTERCSVLTVEFEMVA